MSLVAKTQKVALAVAALALALTKGAQTSRVVARTMKALTKGAQTSRVVARTIVALTVEALAEVLAEVAEEVCADGTRVSVLTMGIKVDAVALAAEALAVLEGAA